MSREFQTDIERLKKLWQDVSDPDDLIRETSKQCDVLKKVTNQGLALTSGRQVLTALALFMVQSVRGNKPVERQYAGQCGCSVTAFNRARREAHGLLENWDSGPSAGTRPSRSSPSKPQTPRSGRQTPTPARRSSRTPQSTPSKRTGSASTAASSSKRPAPTPERLTNTAKRARLELMNPHAASGSQRSAELDQLHARQDAAADTSGSPTKRTSLRSSAGTPFSSAHRAQAPASTPSRSKRSTASSTTTTPTKAKPSKNHPTVGSRTPVRTGTGAAAHSRNIAQLEFEEEKLRQQAQADQEVLDQAAAQAAEAWRNKKKRVPWDFELSYDNWSKDEQLKEEFESWKTRVFAELKALQQDTSSREDRSSQPSEATL